MKIVRKPGAGDRILNRTLKTLDSQIGKIGWFNQHYPDGTSVAQVAATNELGEPSKHIPARSMLRATANRKKAEWRQNMTQIARAVFQGKVAPKQIMELQVLKGAADVQETISALVSPPLAQITIDNRIKKTAEYQNLTTAKARRHKLEELRGNPTIQKPLVETKLLRNSVMGIVEKKA
jgi:hypothetical protein